jgi:plasmid stabilization system protein ParE
MKYRVYISAFASEKLERLIPFIQENWGLSARNNFLKKFNASLDKIESFPESYIKLPSLSGVYKLK